jgi:hypothetical protein
MLYKKDSFLLAVCFVTFAHGAASSSVLHRDHDDSSSGKAESSLPAMDQRFSQTEKTLSFIYYPTRREAPIGHAKMEVGGIVWNLMAGGTYGNRSLAETIASATTCGYPFFRFVFTANADQERNIKQYIYESKWSTNCTRAALYPLSKVGATSVPFPINVSPLATALYLKTGAVLGTNNVQRIEYYGNPSAADNLVKMLPGTLAEAAMLSAFIFGTLLVLCIAGLSDICTSLPL